MKRVFFIIGIIIIVILIGVLVFLLFASDQQKKDIFSAFNFKDTSAGVVVDNIIKTILPDPKAKLDPLRQLSLKRVIGATEITGTSTSSSSPMVFFAEAGTGHIYSMDVNSGQENRVSNITVPTAQLASISSDGSYAAIATNASANGRKVTILNLPQEGKELTSTEVSELVEDFTLTVDDKLLYTTLVGDSLTGRSYDPTKNETKTLFTLPFKEARVRFGEKSTDSVYAYPKTADSLEGYIYEINGGVLNRLPISGFGLSAISGTNYILYSLNKTGTYTSFIYNTTDKTSSPSPFVGIPEKCHILNDRNQAFCGSADIAKQNTATDWYKGTKTTPDSLWLLQLDSNSSTILTNPKELVARDLDVIYPTASMDGVRFYFINKTDGGLWIFDNSLVVSQ
jgi:hypothetical protein